MPSLREQLNHLVAEFMWDVMRTIRETPIQDLGALVATSAPREREPQNRKVTSRRRARAPSSTKEDEKGSPVAYVVTRRSGVIPH